MFKWLFGLDKRTRHRSRPRRTGRSPLGPMEAIAACFWTWFNDQPESTQEAIRGSHGVTNLEADINSIAQNQRSSADGCAAHFFWGLASNLRREKHFRATDMRRESSRL